MAFPKIEDIIHPSRHLDLIIADFEEEHSLDMRRTIIYEVYPEKGSFLVAQPEPPILKSMIGTTIKATFLWYPTPTEPQHYAFHTNILTLTDYTLSPGHQTQAVLLSYPRYFYTHNLRLSYRVQPVKEFPISLHVPKCKDTLSIIDISESGICFSHPKIRYLQDLKPGDRFHISLNFNEEAILRPLVETVRKFEKKEFPKIAFMAVKFLDLNTKNREFLARVIKRIERIILRKRAGLE